MPDAHDEMFAQIKREIRDDAIAGQAYEVSELKAKLEAATIIKWTCRCGGECGADISRGTPACILCNTPHPDPYMRILQLQSQVAAAERERDEAKDLAAEQALEICKRSMTWTEVRDACIEAVNDPIRTPGWGLESSYVRRDLAIAAIEKLSTPSGTPGNVESAPPTTVDCYRAPYAASVKRGTDLISRRDAVAAVRSAVDDDDHIEHRIARDFCIAALESVPAQKRGVTGIERGWMDSHENYVRAECADRAVEWVLRHTTLAMAERVEMTTYILKGGDADGPKSERDTPPGGRVGVRGEEAADET